LINAFTHLMISLSFTISFNLKIFWQSLEYFVGKWMQTLRTNLMISFITTLFISVSWCFSNLSLSIKKKKLCNNFFFCMISHIFSLFVERLTNIWRRSINEMKWSWSYVIFYFVNSQIKTFIRESPSEPKRPYP